MVAYYRYQTMPSTPEDPHIIPFTRRSPDTTTESNPPEAEVLRPEAFAYRTVEMPAELEQWTDEQLALERDDLTRELMELPHLILTASRELDAAYQELARAVSEERHHESVIASRRAFEGAVHEKTGEVAAHLLPQEGTAKTGESSGPGHEVLYPYEYQNLPLARLPDEELEMRLREVRATVTRARNRVIARSDEIRILEELLGQEQDRREALRQLIDARTQAAERVDEEPRTAA